MTGEFASAIRLYRPHAFYLNFTEGPFVYQCFGCLAWRQREEHEYCPDCGGTWQEIWEPPAEIRKAIEELRRRPTIRPSADSLSRVCANYPACKLQVPRGVAGPYCDFCSGC